MRRTRSFLSLPFALALVVIIGGGGGLIATGYGVAQLTSVETEVRVVARPHEDGRVEFAVQQRVGGEWGERLAPSSRYLTPRLIEERAGRWLNSSPITLMVATDSDTLDGGTDEITEPPPQPNRAPIASAGPDASYDLGEIAIQLNGTGSRDPDGDSLTYEWAQTAGPPVTLRSAGSATAWFESARAEQTLTFQLRVADEDGATSTDTVTVALTNSPPTAEAGADQDAKRSQEVTLRGSGNDDALQDNLIYEWSQVAGPPVVLSDVAAATPTFTTPDEPGDLVFSLTVSDGQIESNPDTTTVTVRNTQPVADAGLRQEVSRGERVTLDGRASIDPDGDRLTYRWTQISGDEVRLSNPATPRPSFTAPQTGQLLFFQLEVSDGYVSGTDTVSVNVQYEPVIASNHDTAGFGTRLWYQAKEDAFSGDVRTDVRMWGANDDLLLDVVCFDDGSTAIGFRLLDFERPERDADVPNDLEVMWRLDDGPVQWDTLDVTFIGETPALYFQNATRGFDSDWPQVLNGGKLAVRIGYRGVQEEVFDLDAFARTPVHGNLVNCGSY